MQKKLFDFLTIDYTAVFSDGVSVDSKPFNPTIDNLVFDSRDVKDGSLFFALPGTHTTGNIFIPNAINAGASAIVFEGSFDEKTSLQINEALKQCKKNIPFIKVKSSRFAMAPISDKFYDEPSKKIAIIGVTGTEGKSSTVSFIWQLLRLNGHKAGFISTVQYSLGDEAQANPQHTTTPEAPIIHKYLYQMVQNNCEYAVLETSSHGLSPKLNRTGNILFDCGIFMNVTLEHLEFHGTFEQYKDDKANLFRKLDEHNHKKIILKKEISVPAFGIINLDDKSSEYFINATKQKVFGFTSKDSPSKIEHFNAKNIISTQSNIEFDLIDNLSNCLHIDAPLPGAFNAYNLMAAIMCVSKLTKTQIAQVASLTKNLTPIKGRMTVINKGQPFEVIVDYAHTPSSFETIFPPIKARCNGRMFAVFGSGGERDLKKRPLQGEIAAKFCDFLILTDEDPRGEDSVKLLNMIADGAKKIGKTIDKDLFIIPDRPAAIRKAFKMAQKDDIILLLGKAHENSIIYKDGAHPYDEISEAEKAIDEILKTEV